MFVTTWIKYWEFGENSACFIIINNNTKIITKNCLLPETNIYLIYKIKQLRNIVSDGGCIGIPSLQMFLVYPTDAFHAIVDRFIVRICSGFWVGTWLNQEDCVSLKMNLDPLLLCIQKFECKNNLMLHRIFNRYLESSQPHTTYIFPITIKRSGYKNL